MRRRQVRIRRYFRYYWSRRSVFTNEEEILTGLSSSLRDDVLRFIHREVITPSLPRNHPVITHHRHRR